MTVAKKTMRTKRETCQKKVNRPLAQSDNRELSDGRTDWEREESKCFVSGWQEDTLHLPAAAEESQLLLLEVRVFFSFSFLFFISF